MLRLAAAGGKFLLIVFLIKFLDEKDYATYILVVSTSGYLVYLVGFEFYTYSNREIVTSTQTESANKIVNQLALHMISYVILLPLMVIPFVYKVLPWGIVFWFYPILFLEHINQEIYRLMIALSNQMVASIILFVRQGVWPLILLLIYSNEDVIKGLSPVFAMWLGANIIAVAIGIRFIYRRFAGSWSAKIDTDWIVKGLKISAPFLVATIGTNGIMAVDKYILSIYQGVEYLSAYSLYLSISLSLLLIVDAYVVQFSYQKIISLVKQNNIEEMKQVCYKMLKSLVLISIAHAIVTKLCLESIIFWTEKQFLLDKIEIIFYTTGYAIISALALMPHCVLYAYKCDRWITITGILSFPVFVLIAYLLFSIEYRHPVPLALMLTGLFSLLVKYTGFITKIRSSK